MHPKRISPGALLMAFDWIKAYLRRRKLRARAVVPEVDLPVVRYGARTGVWAVHPDVLRPGSVVYSFGVGDNIAWEQAMIARHPVELHAFDPSPRSIAWVRGQQLPERFHFHPFGLAHFDGDLPLYPPGRTGKFNYSVLCPSGEEEPVLCPVRRLARIAAELGHDRIDVLKMDIEGAEMTALPDLLATDVPVGQLLVEFHYNHPSAPLDRTVALIRSLRAHGYRIFDISPRGYEFSFLNTHLVPAGAV
jgi:FkbM family methyltransferase